MHNVITLIKQKILIHFGKYEPIANNNLQSSFTCP